MKYVLVMMNSANDLKAIGDPSGEPFEREDDAHALGKAIVEATPFKLRFSVLPIVESSLDL